MDIIKSLRDVQERYKNTFVYTGDVNVSAMARDCADHIEKLQKIIDDTVVQGRWCGEWHDECSRCDRSSPAKYKCYCPHCFARMDDAT